MGRWHFQGQSIDDPTCVYVLWTICRLNEESARSLTADAKRSKENSLPLCKAFDPLLLQLDWGRVPKESVQDILGILESSDHRAMRKYRTLFSEVEHPEMLKADKAPFFHQVFLSDYWEDATGRPLTPCTLHERIAGGPVLLMGDAESVLKLGPAPMKDKQSWGQEDSDLMAHYIQVVGQIQRSRWSKTPSRIVSCGTERSGEFPGLEDFVYAAVYFRQLYSDKLLEKSYRCYERFADSSDKVLWARERVNGFAHVLAAQSHFVRGVSHRELIDCFLYGSGLLHSISYADQRMAKSVRKFRGLIREHDSLRMFFELNWSFLQLLGYASSVAIVIHHDYGHWLKNEGIPKPMVYWHSNLFSPHPRTS